MEIPHSSEPEEIPLPPRPVDPKVPTFIESKPHEIVNPIQLAFRKALLPILMTNTKLVREAMRPATTVDPKVVALVNHVKLWLGTDNHTGAKTFGALLDIVMDKPVGTCEKLFQKTSARHHFMPLSVIIPMREFQQHTYVPRMPYVVYRAESEIVYCVDTEGLSSSRLSVMGAKCMAASDEEVFACVDGLTATEIAAMMVHEYFRPVLHAALGIGDSDEPDDETDDEPKF